MVQDRQRKKVENRQEKYQKKIDKESDRRRKRMYKIGKERQRRWTEKDVLKEKKKIDKKREEKEQDTDYRIKTKIKEISLSFREQITTKKGKKISSRDPNEGSLGLQR